MKKVSYLLFLTVLISCSENVQENNSVTETEEPTKVLSFDEKVDEVCDCFYEAKTENPDLLSNCWKLQSDYSKTLDDAESKFYLQMTNDCSNPEE